MGLEMLEEFLPIKPNKQSVPQVRITTLNQYTKEEKEEEVSSDIERKKEEQEEEHYYYHTPPTSPSKNSFELVCPPPPKKRQRPAVTYSHGRKKFFQSVPDDLASIFLPRAKQSTIVTTASHKHKHLAS